MSDDGKDFDGNATLLAVSKAARTVMTVAAAERFAMLGADLVVSETGHGLRVTVSVERREGG